MQGSACNGIAVRMQPTAQSWQQEMGGMAAGLPTHLRGGRAHMDHIKGRRLHTALVAIALQGGTSLTSVFLCCSCDGA